MSPARDRFIASSQRKQLSDARAAHLASLLVGNMPPDPDRESGRGAAQTSLPRATCTHAVARATSTESTVF